MTEFEYINAILMLDELAAYHSMNFIALLFSSRLPDSAVQHALGESRIFVLLAVYSAAWLLSLLFCSSGDAESPPIAEVH